MTEDKLIEETIKNYSSIEEIKPVNKWQKVAHRRTNSFVEKIISRISGYSTKILNAGSGGTEYSVKGKFTHLDIVERHIKHLDGYVVASIEQIPFPKNEFDIVICVGSVLNYSDAMRSVKELSRVLKKGGTLIIEFERSNSADLFFSKQYANNAVLSAYTVDEQKHNLWLYNEHYVRKILIEFGLKPKKTRRYHTISSLVNWLTRSERFSAPFAFFDCIAYPISYFLSHNVIIESIKVT